MNVISFILILLGLLLILVPAKYIIKVDNRVGYRIYLRVLRISGDEDRALKYAGYFYKLFGVVWIFLVVISARSL